MTAEQAFAASPGATTTTADWERLLTAVSPGEPSEPHTPQGPPGQSQSSQSSQSGQSGPLGPPGPRRSRNSNASGAHALATALARITRGALATAADGGPDAAARVDAAGHRIAALMVRSGLTGTGDLQEVVTMLARGLRTADGAIPSALPGLLGAVAGGHASAMGSLLAGQHEAVRAEAAARSEAEHALAHSEARFRAIFTEAPVGIGIADLDGNLQEVNDALQQILGLAQEEMLTRPIESFTHPQDDATVWSRYAALTAGEIDTFRAEKPFRHKGGHDVWTQLTASLVRDPDGHPLFQIIVVEDITDHHRLQAELIDQATHDALTGLPNRALFLTRLEAAITTDGPHRRVAVLLVDLDSFKFVNDSRGHLVGDQVLVAVARRLTATAARRGAFTARLAGDEFVVLVCGPDTGANPTTIGPARLADELLTALTPPIVVDGQQSVHVRASVGVVELPAGDASAEELLRAADLALHAAKEDGKGRVVTHDPSRTARQLSRFRIAADLPAAVSRNELALVYQPLIRLGSGLPHSVEALVRWNHPGLGVIRPDLFVPIAEDTSVIVSMGRWILERACLDLAASPWPAVNINVSVRQLYSPTLVADVLHCLRTSHLDPPRLRIEVTESVLMHHDSPGPLDVLRQLADLGVRIVMDDFGTGYSNLAALRLLPLHEIKLAGTFVAGLHPDRPADPTDQRILRTIVDLAHTLGLTVTAEGVETRAQDQRVRALGCDIGQGHYYAAPGPATARRPWLHVLE